jgi:hypothetical protein
MRVTGVLALQLLVGDIRMSVTASLPRSFADIPYEGKILWNGSSQPIT